MARSMPWRRTPTDTASWRQDQALGSTIYILRQTGPTGFLLKEEGELKNFKVYLGDPHSCTCPTFSKEKEICKHICWVLLKKFKVPRQNPVSWQLGLVEREINEIIRGVTQQAQPSAVARKLAGAANDASAEKDKSGTIPQREIGQEDVCPICQEELLAKHLPVTYCRFSCGNSIHIKCMKVWAQHQIKNGSEDAVKCPMCRESFGPISLLQQEWRNSGSSRESAAERLNQHLGTACKNCHASPITGKCYKCTTCHDYHLCQPCFNTQTHTHHSFQFRQKTSQRWRPVARGTGTVLPEAMVNNLLNRDITDEDYDTLLQLDSQGGQQQSDLTEATVRFFPTERIRTSSTLLAPGQQCRICLRAYEVNQQIRRLPCRHKFHVTCIDNWLLHRQPKCPVDGTVYTNESVKQMREDDRRRQHQSEKPRSNNRGNVAGDLVLEIPGVGIARRGSAGSSIALPHTQDSNNLISRQARLGRHLSSDSIIDTVSAANTDSLGSASPLSAGSSAGRRTRFRPPPVNNRLQGNSHSRNVEIQHSNQSGDLIIESALQQIPDRIASVTGSDHTLPQSREAPHVMPPSCDHILSLGNNPFSADRLVERTVGSSGGSGKTRKPPSGAITDNAVRRGRLQHKPLYRQATTSGNDRQNSDIHRENTQNTMLSQNTRNLFVGHDPSSAAGFTSDFLANTRRLARRAGPPSRKDSSGDTRYRWGNTERIPGEEISLTGNALSGLTLHDIIF